MATLKLRLVTPSAEIVSGDIEMIHLPGAEGEMEILPQHESLLTEIVPGELFYQQKGKTHVLAVGEGFAEITGESVSILTDGAIQEKDIDEKAVEAAIQSAQDALRSTTLIGEEIEATQASLARSLVQLQVKRRRRTV